MKLLNNDINREYSVGDVIESNGEVYLVVKCPFEQDADDASLIRAIYLYHTKTK